MYFINFKWIFDYNTYDIEIFRVGDLNFLFGDFFYGVAGLFEENVVVFFSFCDRVREG